MQGGMPDSDISPWERPDAVCAVAERDDVVLKSIIPAQRLALCPNGEGDTSFCLCFGAYWRKTGFKSLGIRLDFAKFVADIFVE